MMYDNRDEFDARSRTKRNRYQRIMYANQEKSISANNVTEELIVRRLQKHTNPRALIIGLYTTLGAAQNNLC